MKLLFDQNISPRILKSLSEDFQDSIHVCQIGLQDASDSKIFKFARKGNYIIVTFDSDFVDLNLMMGSPPKIIWLRTGNLTTNNISMLIEENKSTIKLFIDSSEEELLEIITYK